MSEQSALPGRHPEMRLVCLGFGYSARAFLRAVRPGAVTGTTRSPEKADALHQSGIRSIVYDGGSSPSLSEAIRSATHVLVSAGPGPGGDPFRFHFERDIANAPDLAWIGYLSTIGVYGDHGGAVVDERTLCVPTADRGLWRLEAEDAWFALGRRIDVPVGVFRLAGIYGPGRSPLVSLKEGRAKRIIKPGQVFNRIHVEDIAQTLVASIARPARRYYNVADNEPAPPQDVIEYAAGLMGMDPPPEIPFDEADMSPMARSFYGDVKRVSNTRLRSELGVRLRYPTYREGLRALWESGTWDNAS
ncbi:SDR family oxidoreductase [Acuticoccus sp. MNP-M23]|uniref:SDR family oxidoreductase n=1 Tax=Acuticoccus sp. MNP-M23 TaxID=3072793 RepID=UPI002815D6E0|nr:SDR family oxidoreductase [Acuticoccus sp. MNP-M23]WMS43764.1 SDR family oxidoreductase [Acuticoccus sp. MNP-M23]